MCYSCSSLYPYPTVCALCCPCTPILTCLACASLSLSLSVCACTDLSRTIMRRGWPISQHERRSVRVRTQRRGGPPCVHSPVRVQAVAVEAARQAARGRCCLGTRVRAMSSPISSACATATYVAVRRLRPCVRGEKEGSLTTPAYMRAHLPGLSVYACACVCVCACVCMCVDGCAGTGTGHAAGVLLSAADSRPRWPRGHVAVLV
jgi:hypothetical protein